MPRLNSDTTARPPYSQCCAIKSKECRDSKPRFGWHSRWRTAACITTLACMCDSTGVDSRGRFSNEPRLHKTKNYIGVLLQCDAAPEHSKRLATPCLPPRASHPEPFEGKKNHAESCRHAADKHCRLQPRKRHANAKVFRSRHGIRFCMEWRAPRCTALRALHWCHTSSTTQRCHTALQMLCFTHGYIQHPLPSSLLAGCRAPCRRQHSRHQIPLAMVILMRR
jgi:hypothetical protein